MGEILQRVWENLIGRTTGPINFRLLIQPSVATFFAIRSGLKDAREGRPAFLWGVLFKPGQRNDLLNQGWKDIGKLFVIAMILDAIYQLIVHRGAYVGEMLITATVLAIVPYILIRGPVNRIARRWLIGKQITEETGNPSFWRGEGKSKEKNMATQAIPKSNSQPMAIAPMQSDWTKPSAIAIPKEGYFEPEQGRYGAIYPKTPANYGFTIIAKTKPGSEEVIRAYGKRIQDTIAGLPEALEVLKLHYLRWVLFDIGNDHYFMYQGIFDTDFDKYTEDAVALFGKYGLNTVFENLEGFPEDWKTNVPAFIKFVREHQRPSFLEYAEYPYASADEIKKALRLKAKFSEMLDLMQ